MRRPLQIGALMASLLLAGAASGLTAARKCETAKLKEVGKYGFCRLKAEAKAVKTGDPPDYAKCLENYDLKWPAIESDGGGLCPSNGDQTAIEAFIAQHSDDLAVALAGGALPSAKPTLKTGQTTYYGAGSDGDLERGASQTFVDNGDGTITDTTTGLMWEKKSDDGSIHDVDNLYSWGMTESLYTMAGTMVTALLAELNGGGGFAGYTDWRIPNANELESIRNLEASSPATDATFNTGCVANCTVTTCSCTRSSLYWSSTTFQGRPDQAFSVDFQNGGLRTEGKSYPFHARAVRGGS